MINKQLEFVKMVETDDCIYFHLKADGRDLILRQHEIVDFCARIINADGYILEKIVDLAAELS